MYEGTDFWIALGAFKLQPKDEKRACSYGLGLMVYLTRNSPSVRKPPRHHEEED